MKVILASGSKARLMLLKQIGIKAAVSKPGIDESAFFSQGKDYKISVKKLAEAKAKKNMHKYKDSVIIAADTLICYKNKIFGKPKNKKEAFETLSFLSGKTHSVITGICIIDTAKNKIYVKHAISSVTFGKISKKEIENYIKTKEYIGCAGAYSIQGMASVFIKSIKGSYSNVVGLPLHIVYKYLNATGYDIF